MASGIHGHTPRTSRPAEQRRPQIKRVSGPFRPSESIRITAYSTIVEPWNVNQRQAFRTHQIPPLRKHIPVGRPSEETRE